MDGVKDIVYHGGKLVQRGLEEFQSASLPVKIVGYSALLYGLYWVWFFGGTRRVRSKVSLMGKTVLITGKIIIPSSLHLSVCLFVCLFVRVCVCVCVCVCVVCVCTSCACVCVSNHPSLRHLSYLYHVFVSVSTCMMYILNSPLDNFPPDNSHPDNSPPGRPPPPPRH